MGTSFAFAVSFLSLRLRVTSRYRRSLPQSSKKGATIRIPKAPEKRSNFMKYRAVTGCRAAIHHRRGGLGLRNREAANGGLRSSRALEMTMKRP